jgi:predicted Na+-dependent transporter
VLLLRGEWLPALRLHAFAPVFLLTLLVLGAGFLLRGRAREVWRRIIRRLEERTPIVPVLLLLLLVYWALRIMLDGAGWRALVT